MNLPHAIDRTVLIRARRSTVFAFFTDSARWATWWGRGSSIEARPGGKVRIQYPEGTIASGKVLEIEPGQRIAFSYGYEAGKPVPPGGSRVTITLRDDPLGTVVSLRHEFADARVAEEHVQGWRYQLSVFANVASAAEYQGVEHTVDAWFAAWNATEAPRRRELLSGSCAMDVGFRDQWSCVQGIDDLVAHIGGAQRVMPGLDVARSGPVRQCQGTVLVDWAMRKDGMAIASGTNVFDLAPDGRIRTGLGVMAAAT